MSQGQKVAAGFVEISANLAPFEQGMARVRREMQATVNSAGLASRQIMAVLAGGGIGVGIYKAVGSLYQGIQASADLGEAINFVKVALGDSAKEAIVMSDVMASAFGANRKEYLDGVASVALLAKTSGYGEKAAAGLSIEMANLANDLASVRNIRFDDALLKIRSGLEGEALPLRAVGVLLSEMAVKAEAARMGLQGLSEGDKVKARASIIRQQLGYAKGDREATKDSPSNVQKEAGGRFANMMESIGSSLMPLWREILGQSNNALKQIGAFLDANKPAFEAWSQGVAVAMQKVIVGAHDVWDMWSSFANSQVVQTIGSVVSTAFGWMGTAVTTFANLVGPLLRNIDNSFLYVQTVIKQFAINAVEGFYWFMDAAGSLASWFGSNWKEVIADAFRAVWTIARNTFANIVNLAKSTWEFLQNPSGGFNFSFTPLLEGFQKTMADLPAIAKPAFTSLQNELDAISGAMVDREMKRLTDVAAKGAEVAGVVKPLGADAQTRTAKTFEGGEKVEKDKKSEFVGLADFAKKIQTGVFGKDKDKAVKDTAQNTERALGFLEKIANKPFSGGAGFAVGPA